VLKTHAAVDEDVGADGERDSSEARKGIALVTSLGSPKRPCGTIPLIELETAFRSSHLRPSLSLRGCKAIGLQRLELV
jgi:hypothetical protein